MLAKLKAMFQSSLGESADSGQLDALSENLITATLMVEVMNSDQRLDAREEQEFIAILVKTLGLDEEAADELRALTHEKAEESTSLYEFTAQVNTQFSVDAKLSLIKNMWRIAFADGEVDRYEDGVIRRVSELIYVSHSDFIRMKIAARDGV